jgi:hypothetical protein
VKIKNYILVFFFVLGFFSVKAQTYNYSYTDPCTGNIKNIIVPINGSVTVGYYGFVQNFTSQDFYNGNFEIWANDIFTQYDGSPCSEIIGLGGQINIAQDVALNTVGIINSLSSLMDISNGATDFLSGTLTAASNSSNTGKKNSDKKNNNTASSGNQENNNPGSSGNNNTENNTTGNTNVNTNQTNTNNSEIGTNNSVSNNQENGTSNTNGGNQTSSGTNEASPNTGGAGSANTNVGAQGETPAGSNTTQNGSNENGNSSTLPTINNQTTNTNGNNVNNSTSSNNSSTGGNGSNGINNNSSGNNQEPGQEVGNSPNSGTNTSDPNSGSGNTSSQNGSPNGNGNSPNSEETQSQTEEQGGQTNITQGATKTVNQNRDGGKPTVIASSDFVGFNFQNSEVRTGLKLTGGYHNMRWDGATARGGLMDYVSAQRGPNITGYHAWINKKSVGLLSGTLSIGFEGRGSLYGTIAGGQMFMFPKVPHLKAVYMATVSYGQVYKTPFIGSALIAGGMYDLKFGKRIDVKLMSLFVYSPYVSYYNDLVLKSPYVILPSLGTNINITKRFKFNINAGGAWAIKVNTLNYTITCGTRLLVGQ